MKSCKQCQGQLEGPYAIEKLKKLGFCKKKCLKEYLKDDIVEDENGVKDLPWKPTSIKNLRQEFKDNNGNVVFRK
jgi:hypothetical protein